MCRYADQSWSTLPCCLQNEMVDANGTETRSCVPCALINPALHRFRPASLDSHYSHMHIFISICMYFLQKQAYALVSSATPSVALKRPAKSGDKICLSFE